MAPHTFLKRIGPPPRQCHCSQIHLAPWAVAILVRTLDSSHWSSDQVNKDIVWKELFAIASAVNTWGNQWPQKKVMVHCDNSAVVDIWKKGTTKCPEAMALVCMIYFCATQHNIHVLVTHVAETDNSIPDTLFRFQVQHFHKLTLEAAANPDTISAWPIQLLRASSATTIPQEWLSPTTEHTKLE